MRARYYGSLVQAAGELPRVVTFTYRPSWFCGCIGDDVNFSVKQYLVEVLKQTKDKSTFNLL